MYSGTSPVPKISSGSRSRLKKQREVNREIANKSKKQIQRKLTLEWYASLVECCLPWWVAFPCPPWTWGFLLWGRGEKMCNDGRVYKWSCRAPRGAILLTMRAHWEWWLVGVRYWNTKRQGFLPECEGFSLDSVYGSRIEDFLRILRQGGSCFRVFGSSKVPEFVWEQWSSHLQAGGDHHNTCTEIEILYLLPKTKHP
jgi:hypothetical protein